MAAELTIAHYIQTLAEKYGDRPAIHFKSAFRTFTFSYRDIRERCLRVANYLSQRGIRKGDRILVWSYNGQEYGSILLGCALSGVVAVPIDFSSKADFVGLIAEKVGAKHLFHSKRRPFPAGKLSHLHVEDLDHDLAQVPIAQTDFGVGEQDIYEIVYTSGTTSDPKGVVLTNRNIVSNILNCAQVMPISGDNSFLSVLPLSHMFEQVAGFFYPLANGCTVTYLHSRKSTTIIEALQRHRVSVMVVVPVFLNVLRENILREMRSRGKEAAFSRMLAVASHLPRPMRRVLFGGVHEKLGGRLRMFITSGSALDGELEAFWSNLGFLALQGYGLTEASAAVTLNTPRHHRAGSAGRGLPHQKVHLGPDNEIWIAGGNVTPGYYENPQENAARFQDGWYKTGDIGEFDADGYLHIRGRMKNMIKSASGLNVYPEDIETVLSKIAGVRDSCVVGIEESGDVRIHAVLLMDKGRSWDNESARAIIESANARLQPHQHIQGFTIWPHEDFPRTNTLKIKRGPVLEEIRMGKPASGILAQSTGDRILDLVADLAKIDPRSIRPDANLVTDLGLDSIARVELATLLEEEFNVEIDESALDARTTVGRLREIVAERRQERLDYEFPRWSRRWAVRAVRRLLQLLVFRVPSLFSWTTVKGRENLAGIETPVIFISNHICHYDTLYILRSLPWRLRKVALAAAADLLYEYRRGESWKKWLNVRFRGFWTTLLMNTFPFSRGVHVKKTFEYMGELLDDGWNILLFPEGRLSTTGQIEHFRSGIGLLTQAMQVPVVPIKLEGLYELMHTVEDKWASWVPRRFGRVRVIIGKPMRIDEKAEPDAVARLCEEAIRNLK